MVIYTMGRMIRLDNRFVYKDGSKYFLTEITNVGEWKKMIETERKKAGKKNVTGKVKKLLKKYKAKGNLNIKTKPSKKKLKTLKKKVSKKKLKGGGWPFATQSAGQTGGWLNPKKQTGGWGGIKKNE